MTSSTDRGFKNLARQPWVAAVVLASLLLMATIWYSTAKFESPPVGANTFITQNLAASGPPADRSAIASNNRGQSPVVANSALAPFLDIVPSQDGAELFISAGGVGELGGTAFANIGIGPGHYIGSWTMTYSNTAQAYVTTAPGFTPNTGASGPINITTTLGLDSGTVDFNRAYVPASTSQSISSIDGNLQLTLVSTDTITFDTYVAVVPSYAPPGAAPWGHRFVGSIYSVRAAGALLVTDKPMSLRLYYSEATLAGADPHTLSIFAWDAYNERWDDLGGRLFYDQQCLSVATSRFTTYALMAILSWRDDFDDFNGLNFPDEVKNVTLGGTLENRTLVLMSTATSGSAVSKPITPTTSFANWGSLTFTRTVDPPTTTLTVDVLTLDGIPVLTDAASGTDLTALDASGYPALKLRATLSSTLAGETPTLDTWHLTWQVEEHKVYLPVVVKQE